MAIIGRQLYAIRTALYDPTSQLNLKYIIAYVITIIILLLFFVLAFTGVLSRWEAALNTKNLAWLDNIEGTVWTQIITFAIGTIMLFCAVYGVLLWARTRVLRNRRSNRDGTRRLNGRMFGDDVHPILNQRPANTY